METLTKNQKLKLIKAAYNLLDVLNNVSSFKNYRDDLFAMCGTEEKGHRRFMSFGESARQFKITTSDAARLFVVYRVAQYLTNEVKTPDIKDFIVMQQSAFLAASLVANYRAEIEKAWQGIDLEQLCALDYADMVQND